MNYPTIQNHETLKQTINARDLHKCLEIRNDFSSWMKDQVRRAGLVEYADYVLLMEKHEQVSGAKYRKEYHLTLTAASDIGMMSQTAKGKEVRDYYRECERKAHAAQPALTYEQIMKQALSMADEKVKALENKVDVLEPKAEALDRIATADGSMNITNAAKHLQVRPKDLFATLSAKRWIYRRVGGTGWVGYQDKVQQGLLEHKVTIQIVEGVERMREQVRLTAKGMAKIADRFIEEKI